MPSFGQFRALHLYILAKLHAAAISNSSRVRPFAASAVFFAAITFATANAGELYGRTASCDLNSGSKGCEWKPKDCHKPIRPFIIASTVSDYNFAVGEFSNYLQRAREYKQCIVDDAKSDVGDRFPALVINGVKEETEQVDEDIDSARRSLDLAKIGADQ